MPAGSSPAKPPFTFPIPELQRRLRALLGAKTGLCLSDVARYIGRPYWQARALAYGERRMTAEDQVALTQVFVGLDAQVCVARARDAASGFHIEVTDDGPRLRR